MSYYKKSSLTLAMLAAFTILPSSILGEQSLKPVSAQSAPTTNTAPTLPSGSQIKIDGSSSLKTINQNLKDRFQKKFAGTKVETGEMGTDEAIKALEAGTINLAAIGRPLTKAEEGQGLKQVPISRYKIAIIISPNNPFKGDITLEQFAKIFRGEIKNWSEVGGSAGEIQVIDRPETSDTRRSFNNYPVFQSAPLKTGSNGVSLTEDDTEIVVQKLGKNGIGYAIADQVRDRKDVKIVPMHKTLPTDPRYPFSQPLAYAYKGPNPSPEVKAFLCEANTSDYAKEGAIVSTEFCEEKTVAAETSKPAANAPVASAPTAEPVTPPADSFPNWLGWLLLPVAGLAGLWFLGRGTGAAPVAAPVVPPVAAPVVPPAIAKPSRLILTPRDCQNAYAYWEVPSDRLAELRDQGGQKLALRLYDVTDTPNPTVFETFNADANEQDLHLPIAQDDRDYKAELGYLKSDGEWLSIATADSVRVPACEPVGHELGTVAPIDADIPVPEIPELGNLNADIPVPEVPELGNLNADIPVPEVPEIGGLGAGAMGAGAAGLGAIGAGAAALSGLASRPTSEPKPSRIILVPRDSQSAYAYWEASESEKTELKQQGGEQFTLKIHDVTAIDLEQQSPHDTQEYALEEIDEDKHVPIHASDRDYLAEIGYKTANNHWLSLAKSSHIHVHVPSDPSSGDPGSTGSNFATAAIAGGMGAIGATAAIAGGLFNQGKNAAQSTGENLGDSASNLFEGITEKSGNVLDSATGFVGGLFNQGKDAVQSTGENLGDSASNLFEGTTEKGGNVLDSATGFVGGLFDKGKDAVSGGVDAVHSTGEELANSTSNLVEGTTEKGGNVLDSATDFLGGLFEQGKDAVSGGVDSIKSAGEQLRDSAGNLIDSDHSDKG